MTRSEVDNINDYLAEIRVKANQTMVNVLGLYDDDRYDEEIARNTLNVLKMQADIISDCDELLDEAWAAVFESDDGDTLGVNVEGTV